MKLKEDIYEKLNYVIRKGTKIVQVVNMWTSTPKLYPGDTLELILSNSFMGLGKGSGQSLHIILALKTIVTLWVPTLQEPTRLAETSLFLKSQQFFFSMSASPSL